MVRTLCVLFPDWSLGNRSTPPAEAVLVVAADGRIAAVSPAARTQGAEPGMPRREAEMLCPGAVILERDLAEEWQRFELVVSTIEEIIPRVEVVEPGMALVPLSGATRYYGGEEPVVEIIAAKLDLFQPRIGVADGPFAATWAARTATPGTPMVVSDTRRFLNDLDISSLMGESPDAESMVATFRWLGVTTLGSLAGLPREALASRFGAPGLIMHRLAHGEDRMLDPRPIPPETAVELRFEEPLETLDQAGFAARAAAATLMTRLGREGIAPHRMTIEIESAGGESRLRVWRSLDPFTEGALADRVWWQLRAWLESGQIRGGVIRLKLDPADLSGGGRQMAFFEDTSARIEAERALARAQTLLDPAAVVQAAPRGGRMPSERIRWFRWGEDTPPPDSTAPWPGSTPAPAPSLVPPEPRPLEVEWDEGLPVRVRLGSRWEPILTWSGPWRLSRKWWMGEQAVDRYQIVTSAGAFLCVVDRGQAFLVGIYD
jgi:protein ImuB